MATILTSSTRGDIILIASFFITIGASMGWRLLFPPARARWLVLVCDLWLADLLLVKPGNNWWIPLRQRAMLGNVTSDIPAAVSRVLLAVPLLAVTIHRVVRAAVNRSHVVRGA